MSRLYFSERVTFPPPSLFPVFLFLIFFILLSFHLFLCWRFTRSVPVLLQEIQSLLTNWKGPDLVGYGELVLEGTFRIQRAKNERTLFLFDKLLLITKKREETYTYKAHILVRH